MAGDLILSQIQQLPEQLKQEVLHLRRIFASQI